MSADDVATCSREERASRAPTVSARPSPRICPFACPLRSRKGSTASEIGPAAAPGGPRPARRPQEQATRGHRDGAARKRPARPPASCVHAARAGPPGKSPISFPSERAIDLDAGVADVPQAAVRSFCRQRVSSSRIRGGVSAGSASQSGSAVRIAARTSDAVSPAKGRCPESISKRTQPKAQMSVLLSTGFPRACSGLMNSAVPRMTPGCVPSRTSVGESESVRAEPVAFRRSLGEAEVEDLDPARRA